MDGKKVIAVFSTFFVFTPIYAQEQALVLDWATCVQLALDKNPEFRSAVLNVDSNRSSKNATIQQLLPSVGVSTSYNDSDTSNGSTQWRAQGDASIDIFNMGTYAAVRSADATYDQAAADLQLTSSHVRSDLKRAFVNLLYSQEQASLDTRIRELREQNARMVTLKYQAGRESKGNMMKAQAEYKDAIASLNQSQRSERVFQFELARQLGFDEFGVIKSTGQLKGSEIIPAAIDGQNFVENHPRVRSQLAGKRKALAALSEARSAFWPTLSAGYSRSYVDSEFFPGNPHWSTNATASYRIFSNGPLGAFYRSSAARADADRAELGLRSTRNQVRSDLESAQAGWLGRQEDVGVSNELLLAARQRNAESSIRYSSGLMSFEDWERVVTELVTAERAYLQAERDAVLAEADWDLARGLPLETK